MASASELCSDILCLLISGSVGLYSILVQLLMVGFFSKMSPINVDGGPDWHRPPCIAGSPPLHNLLLLLLFTVPHSAVLRGPPKKLLRVFISERYYKTFYVWISSNFLATALYFWQPMTTTVWSVQSPLLSNVIFGLNILCWGGVQLSLITLDPVALLGIKEPLFKLMEWPTPKPHLVQTGVYGLVRHPVYTCLMAGFWITPTMSLGHLLIASVFTFYTVLGTLRYEEPELVKTFGQDYIRYREKTPCFFPLPGFGGGQERKTE